MGVLARLRSNISAGRDYAEWEGQRGRKTCIFCLEPMTYEQAQAHYCTPSRTQLRQGQRRARKLKKAGGLQILE